MGLEPVLTSRIHFAFVVSFHILFPAFTIGLADPLATIEGMRLATGDAVYRGVFDFWLKVFSLSFGMGVVSGIVMAFQFGTNWSVLSERTGPIVRLRWPHMLLAASLTTGMSVIATGAWYLLRATYPEEGRVMLRWGALAGCRDHSGAAGVRPS